MELMGTLLSSDRATFFFSPETPGARSCTTDLQCLIPRLWPFLGHNICSVRRSSLQALSVLLNLDKPSTTNAAIDGGDVGVFAEVQRVNSSGSVGVNAPEGKSWLRELLQPLLCQLFQRFLLEGDQENRELLLKVQGVHACGGVMYM